MQNFFTSLKWTLLCVGLMLARTSVATTVSASIRGNLPSVLVESSAVDYTGTGDFWSLNDAGNTPQLFRFGNTCTLKQTLTLSGVPNHDWEELTHDNGRNYMFVGDFGNNNCDRTNLRIYKIPYPSAATGNSVSPDLITFTYPDQTRFPSPWMNFDVESFFHFHGSLFLFTKADGSAIGYTKMYKLPDVPGNYVATLVDSFYTNDRTTSAAVSPDGTSIILISNTRIHLFRNFVGTDFFHGTHTLISISGGWTQKEGVDFSTNNEIYLTDENSGNGNHLYYIDLSPWIPAAPVILAVNSINTDNASSVYPNPANDHVNVTLNSNISNASVSIFDMTGKMIFHSPIENSEVPFEINTAILPAGIYFYRIYQEAKEVQTSRLIISH